jgi:chromosome segregation ATPase
MARGLKKVFALVLMCGLGLGAGLAFGAWRMNLLAERHAYAMDKAGETIGSLKRKYQEEKALAESLQGMRVSLEGKARVALAKADKIKAETDTALAKAAEEKAALAAALAKMTADYEARGENIAKWSTAYEELKTKHAETLAAAEKKAEELGRALEGARAELAGAKETLGGTDRDLRRCAEHNARLCVLAEELVVLYENKGVLSAVMQKEPLTQIKKVEVEGLGREYADKIAELRREKSKENR